MPQVVFIMAPGQSWHLRELAGTLAHELERQGVPSSLHVGGFPPPQPGLVYALLGPEEYVALQGEEALPDDSMLDRTIFICAQHPDEVDHEDNLQLLRRAGAVFDLQGRSVLAMRRLGIAARSLKPGYSQALDRFDPEAERPIDVMFLGTHSLRRTKYLSRCARVLSRHSCLLQIADGTYPNPGDPSSFPGEGKWALLAQTKIVINLHRRAEPYFEWRRALDAIHAGAVLVTEHSGGLAPLVAGEHLLAASPESLPFLVETALRDPARMARIRAQAYERVTSWLPFALSVGVLRAAVVELVGQSVPPTAVRGRAGGGRLKPAERWDPAVGGEDAQIRSLRRETQNTRIDLVDVRRQITRLEQIVQADRGASRRVRIAHESPAWSARRAPRLSVVTALGGDAGPVHATLDSVARSWMCDYELIIVDAGSSDDSWDVARAWLREHPRVPARLAAQTADRGLGAARNTAVDYARARCCLILDSGTEIYPRALEVLAETLDAMPDAAFVYPIVEVSGETEGFVAAGGDYLMSFYGWEPGRLRLGNYVSTPALIRTDRLRELGGFATDPRLHGWEDYDLWCRIAEQDWRGQLIPQMLARRPAPAATPVLSTIRPSEGAALSMLAQRAPSLLSGIVSPV